MINKLLNIPRLALIALMLLLPLSLGAMPIEMPLQANPKAKVTLPSALQIRLSRSSGYSITKAENGVVPLRNGATVLFNAGIPVGVRIPTLSSAKLSTDFKTSYQLNQGKIYGRTLILSSPAKQIGVVDLTGRTILAVTNSDRLTLDLPQGIYILRYDLDGQKVSTRVVMS